METVRHFIVINFVFQKPPAAIMSLFECVLTYNPQTVPCSDYKVQLCIKVVREIHLGQERKLCDT